MAAASREGIYRRMSVRMWGDERFMRLSPMQPSGQSLWIYALSGPHTGPIPGVFVAGRAALAESLGWNIEDFGKAFDEVLREGLAEFDPKTRLWFIPKAIHHNMPPNPNVVLSWRQTWALLPESDLRERVAECLRAALYGLSEAFGKAFDEACGKPSEKAMPNGMAKQEQEQEQEKEKRPSVSSPRPTIPCPYQSIVDRYHEKLPELPRVKVMTDARQRAMRKEWGWVLSSTKESGERRATTAEEALTWFGDYFERARSNDFVMGRTLRSAEHATWRAGFDYVLSEKGRLQIIEKTEVAA